MQENIPHELLKYLKQQNLSTTPLLPAMQQLQDGMDSISRTDLGEDEKAKQFLQLQNRYLTFKQQLNTNTVLPNGIRPEEMNTSRPEVNLPTSTGDSTTVTALSTPLNAFNVTPNLNQAAMLQTAKALITTSSSLNPAILTPPPKVETPSPIPAAPKRKRQRIQFVSYLDDDESTKNGNLAALEVKPILTNTRNKRKKVKNIESQLTF